MKKDDIIALPNPHLRQKSTRVHVVTDDIRKLVANMTEASLDWEDSRPHEISAALAAPQVDQLYRVVIIRNNFDDKTEREFFPLINPEIIKQEGDLVEDFEGCLSVKNVYGKVKRHSKIRVRALDLEGNEIRFRAEGFLARVIQHEIDHCNGILFVDHIREIHDAFYELDDKGELQSLDYDTHIKGNHELWSE